MVTNIPSEVLRRLVKLSEHKDGLLAQGQKIEQQMLALQRQYFGAPKSSGSKARVTVSRPSRAPRGRRARPGALKARVLQALKSAGARGVTIRQLADQLRIKPANLYVWFNGTGRKVSGLKKIGPAKYRLGK